MLPSDEIFFVTLYIASLVVIVFSIVFLSFVLITLCVRSFVTRQKGVVEAQTASRYAAGRFGQQTTESSLNTEHQEGRDAQEKAIVSTPRPSGHSAPANIPAAARSQRLTHADYKRIYSDLMQFCIVMCLVSDLLMALFYMPTNSLRVISAFLFSDGDLDPSEQLAETSLLGSTMVLSEITEMFVFSSGIFTLLLTYSLYRIMYHILSARAVSDIGRRRSQQTPATPTSGTIFRPHAAGGLTHNSSASSFVDDAEESDVKPLVRGTPVPVQPEVYYNAHGGYGAMTPFSGDYLHPEDSSQVDPSFSLKSQQEHEWKVSAVRTRIGLLYTALAFLFPFAVCIVYIALDLRFQLLSRDDREKILSDIIPDQGKTFIYLAIEVSTILFRVLIFYKIRRMNQSVPTVSHTSAKAQLRKNEELRILRMMALYSLPFLLFGAWIILYRVSADIEFIIRLAREGFDPAVLKMSIFCKTLMAIHYVLSPIRNLANAFVYVVVSKKFRDFIRSCCCGCCCSRRSKRREKRVLSNVSDRSLASEPGRHSPSLRTQVLDRSFKHSQSPEDDNDEY